MCSVTVIVLIITQFFDELCYLWYCTGNMRALVVLLTSNCWEFLRCKYS